MARITLTRAAMAGLVALVGACWACAALPGVGGIRGPLGPMPFPRRAPVPAALHVASAALAFVVVVAALRHLVRRRRGWPPPPVVPSGLEGGLDDLDSATFYGVLLGAVRDALDGTVPAARSLTARELADVALAGPTGTQDVERWRRLCAHAELSRYGGGIVDTLRRGEDLGLVREVVEGLLGAGAREAEEERHES